MGKNAGKCDLHCKYFTKQKQAGREISRKVPLIIVLQELPNRTGIFPNRYNFGFLNIKNIAD